MGISTNEGKEENKNCKKGRKKKDNKDKKNKDNRKKFYSEM